MAFLAAAVVLLSFLVNGWNLALGVSGLACVVVSIILLVVFGWQFVRYDAEVNKAEKKEDAPKAH